MCNCSNKRDSFQQEVSVFANNPVMDEKNEVKKKLFENSFFEYTGKTGLKVQGTITGNVYRFDFSGDVKEIDYRDASAMIAVPILKKVKLKKQI